MRFTKVESTDFAIFGENNYVKVDRLYFNDPETFGSEVLKLILRRHVYSEHAFTLCYFGDNKYLLLSFESSNFESVTLLSEVRNDGIGMEFIEPIPDVQGNAALPIFTAIGSGGFMSVKLHSHDKPYSSVTEVIIGSMKNAFAVAEVEGVSADSI